MQSDHTSPVQTEQSLRHLFQNALVQGILQSRFADVGHSGQPQWLASDLPVKRIQKTVPGGIFQVSEQKRVQYVSAIAHRLAAIVNHSPKAIAQELANSMQTVSVHTPYEWIGASEFPLWLHSRVEATETGWIFFSLSDTGLALWLDFQCRVRCGAIYPSYNSDGRAEGCGSLKLSNQLAAVAASSDALDGQKESRHWQDLIWQAQYVHARCCAVARLAAEVGILSQQPQWLSSSSLRGNTELDLLLIGSLIDAWDHRIAGDAEPASPKKKHRRLEQQLLSLSQQTLIFYTANPLFGDMLRHEPELAIARLNLLQLARFGLKHLLEQECRAIAPEFL